MTAAAAFVATLREEAMGRGPAAAAVAKAAAAAEGAGSKLLEERVDEMLRDVPRCTQCMSATSTVKTNAVYFILF